MMTAEDRIKAFVQRWRGQLPTQTAQSYFPNELRQLIKEAMMAENLACEKVARDVERTCRDTGSSFRALLAERIAYSISKRREG